MDDLPDEVLLEIFSYLPLDDMARSALVCERWHALLKGKKQLWRCKEWRSDNVGATQRFLVFSAGIPRLKSLQVLFGKYSMCVAWPYVTMYLLLDTPLRSGPYLSSFDTESLMVSIHFVEHVSSYIQFVDRRTLRRICITSQYVEHTQLPVGANSTSVPISVHYMDRVRIRRGPKLPHSDDRCYPLGDPAPPGAESMAVPEGVVTPEAGAGPCVMCPALEVLNVHCWCVSDQQLTALCGLGPLRVVRVESRGLRDLRALRGLGPHLWELAVAHCMGMGVGPSNFSELCELTELRTLQLGKCRLEEAELRELTAGMPHLRSLSLNGRELLACNN